MADMPLANLSALRVLVRELTSFSSVCVAVKDGLAGRTLQFDVIKSELAPRGQRQNYVVKG
jgi:hypothetical protein